MASEEESTLDTILDYKRKDPFVPFRIVMTSGDKYLIENPDSLAIGSSQLHYDPPRSDRGVHVRLNQIASVEGSEAPDKRPPRRKAS
jgi:hypothetical protein